MLAISFDLDTVVLRKKHGDSYTKVYAEVKTALKKLGFEPVQESVYMSQGTKNIFDTVVKAVSQLAKMDDFRESVKDVQVFEVKNYSNLTETIKNYD